ncbi:hypothetical protein BASA82_001219 [Batrachochytrium salamandrivorans]|nr:hypothetical protein BASA82_001219 [Batrachochytrium salamandrivorans]
MRISTGIILSILSTNVFAIEHPNGAHPGSLLARRAVVADTNGPFLQKRNNNKNQEEPAKPKTSGPNPYSHQKGYVYVKDLSKDDPNLNPNPSDGAEEGSTNSVAYDPDQDDENQDERENVYAGLDVDQGRLSFVDAPGGSLSRVLGSIKKGLSRAKLNFELALSKESALISSDAVTSRLGGEKGVAIGKAVYDMFLYALETSMCYKGLYKGSAKSPFGLKLASSTPSGLKKRYSGLQYDVLGHIKLYILDIKVVIEQIFISPKNVICLLEMIMESTDNFYEFILNAKSRYSHLSKDLKISDDEHLEDLEMHVKAVETYKCGLSGQFNKIKDMVEDHKKNSDHKSLSKALLFSLGFKERSEVRTKPAKD